MNNTLLEFKADIKALIARNEFSQAFDMLTSILKEPGFQNKLVLLQSRYNRLLDQDVANLANFKDLDVPHTKLANDTLQLIDGITEAQYRQNVQGAEREFLLSRIETLETRIRELNTSLRNSVGFIDGKRLFQYHGYYPINIEPETNIPSLNHDIFIKAVRYFLQDDVYDRLAASDIVYLRKDNLDNDFDILGNDAENIQLYNRLVEKYDLRDFIGNFKRENEIVLGNYIRLVNEFGDTLRGIHMEILLHNVRNPLKSVIAAKNTENISGRKLNDPSTRFVVEYVKYQGKHLIKAFEGDGKIGYLKEFRNGRKVKATTTPIFHHRYGLVGIVCINIDIESISALSTQEKSVFFDRYIELFTQSDETELLKRLM